MFSRSRKAALAVGLVLVVGAVTFSAVGVPALVRFPSHLDKNLRYTGTYTSFVDQKTLLPLATPSVGAFSLDRHIKIVHSTFSTVTIREDLTLHEGNQPPLEQHHQYVMDRRSMKFVNSADSWAFFPSAASKRGGTYRLQFPMGTNGHDPYSVWNNETDTAVKLGPPDALHHHPEAGVSVIDFHGTLDHAVTPAYRHWLASNGFPMSVSPAQLQAQLSAQGIDVAAALNAVAGRLNPQESAVLSDALSKPVPLQYRYVYNGLVSIEPHTGAIMDVHTQIEGLEVKPDLSGVAKLQPLLARYSSLPAVKAVGDGLNRLVSAPPQMAAQFKFTETAASSHSVGNDAKHQMRLMRIIEVWVPWTLGLLGAMLIAAAVLRRRRPRTPPTVVSPQPEDRPAPAQPDASPPVLVP